MSTFHEIRKNITNLQTAWHKHEKDIYERRQTIRLLQQQVKNRRQGQGATGPLEAEPEWPTIQRLEQEIADLTIDKTATRRELTAEEVKFDTLGSTQDLVKEWLDDVPVLLFPLRVHTRFVRVKHIAKAKQEFLLNINDPTALNVPGVSAGTENWSGNAAKEILSLQALRTAEDNNQRKLGNQLFTRLVTRQIPGNPRWLRRRVDTYELLVRIYPDDVFVHSHEESLTPEELQAGKDFWQEYWEIEATHAGEEAETTRETKRVVAWKKLQDTYLPARAAWIYRATQPANFPPNSPEGFSGQPDFSQLQVSLRASEWTKPMRTYVLPERFVVRLYHPDRMEEITGNRIVYPLALSHDPDEAPGDSSTLPDEVKWITDFSEAEKIGMAVRIPISQKTYEEGISKLIVVGVNLSRGAEEAKEALEKLLYNHQYKDGGLAILPQGTPTNNFAQTRSGYTFFGPEAAQVFEAVHQGIPAGDDLHWSEKKDGHFLAQGLDIDPQVVKHLFQSGAGDIAGAGAMNTVLWPATLGYYLDQFCRPLFSPETIEAVRRYFTTYLSGRGWLPAVQIGHQPYGILATTDYTQFAFSPADDPFLQKLYTDVLRPLDIYWDRLKGRVKYLHNLQDVAGDQASAIHKYSPALVQMIDLHASSETFFFRPIIGEYFVWNTFRASFPGRDADIKIDDQTYLDKWPVSFIWGSNQGREYYLPTELSSKLKRIFGKLSAFTKETLEKNRIFQHHHPLNFQALAAPVIDQFPPSEIRRLSNLPGQEFNYLQQLLALDAVNLGNLVRTDASVAEGEPKALFYLLARQALSRAYLETAIALTTNKDTIISSMDFELEHLTNAGDPAPGKEAVRFLKKATGSTRINDKLYKKNKWDYLDAARATEIDAPIKAFLEENPGQSILERLANVSQETAPLAQMKLSLRLLSDYPTASLHRLFSEHIDLCSYRLDAWLQGLVHRRLQHERAGGIYLGAYGFLEKVEKGTAPAVIFRVIDNPEMIANSTGGIFGPANNVLEQSTIPVLHFQSFVQAELDLETALKDAWIYLGETFGTTMEYDEANPGVVVASPIVPAGSQGFMHTPSQAHAITAAILRSGFVAGNPTQNHEAFAINLSSARVRSALYLIEGVKNGQELPELLGYQFERYLHDQDNIPLDGYLLDIRKRFPLRTDPSLPVDPNKPIEAQQAYRVVDGWALTEFYRSLPPNQAKQQLAQTFHIAANHLDLFVGALEKLNQNVDAVSDLLLSESVFQVARGNLGRAATALKMFNNEAELDRPEILQTPQRHTLLSHMVGIHFDNSKTEPAWPGVASDMAVISPQLNHWLASQLPAPEKVGILVEAAGTVKKMLLAELQLQPIDLIALFREQEVLSEGSELSERVRSHALTKLPNAMPASIRIHYQDKTGFGDAEASLVELKPLIHLLAGLLKESRPMLPTDLQRSTQTDLQADHPMPTLNNDRLLEAFRQIGLAERVTPIASIEDKYTQWLALEKLGKEIFGESSLIVPEFKLANEAAFTAAYQFPDLLAEADHPVFAVEEWMQGLAQVRPQLKIFQQISQWQQLFALSASRKTWKIVQLPFDQNKDHYRWLGIAYPEYIKVAGDVLSLALILPENFAPQTRLSGLVIDHWREELPEKNDTTGIAMHYDQPNVEPPQVMLLCVSPRLEGAWNWEKLCAVITDTMDRAKKRGIDPDLIAEGLPGDGAGGSPFQYLLPGVLAPICENGETPWVNFGER